MMKRPENLEKIIFHSIAGILLILMPILSLNSGISGDEETYHFPHGKNVYNYYTTFGKDTTCLHYDNSVLHMYGPVFDVSTVAAIKIFKPEDPYAVRHIMNSLAGWTAILFAALIAVMIGGWRAGIITLLFMFLSPRFLGHSYNNPKDIPNAAAYIFTIFAIFRYLKNFPEMKYRYAWPVALGIGLSIGVRVGGLLLAVYFVFFAGLYYLLTSKRKEILESTNLHRLMNMLTFATLIGIAGYIIGIILWPYAHKAPIAHTIEALKYMEKYGTSLKQIFEGKFIWSDNVPVYYLPKYIFMTIPEYIIAGLVLFFVFIKQMKKENTTWLVALLFASIFPVVYIIYKQSNVYGGWRHVMFIYPGLVIIAALGVNACIDFFKNKYIKYSVITVVTALMILPLSFIIRNHPHEYIYYNTITGGVKKAYSKYEMDYFYHSLRAGSEWLIKNKIENAAIPKDKKIIVATNHSILVSHYFRNYKDKVQITYIRYYERGNSDWDYAVLANSYVNPYQLRKNIWPPVNTIHSVNVDTKPICVVLERKDKSDFQGYQMMTTGNYEMAIQLFNRVLATDKKYEMVYYNQAEAYFNLKMFNEAITSATECLKLYPDYDRALNVLGMSYLNLGQSETAMGIFLRNIKKNPKFVISYYYAGLISAQSNDQQSALKYLMESINVNASYKPSYYLIANIYEAQGKPELAKKFIEYANSIP